MTLKELIQKLADLRETVGDHALIQTRISVPHERAFQEAEITEGGASDVFSATHYPGKCGSCGHTQVEQEIVVIGGQEVVIGGQEGALNPGAQKSCG